MYKRIGYIVLTVCFFSSCTTYLDMISRRLYSDKLNKVNVGMTKTEVLNLMGSPNDKQADNYGDEAWQYFKMGIYTVIMFYNDKVTEISSNKNTQGRIDWEKSSGFIKAKRTEDEVKAKELGYPSVEAYYQVVKRQSFGNLMALLLYNTGIPFSKGDIITVPAGMLMGIDRKNDGKKINYLVQITGNPDSRAIYIVSTRELQTYGNVIREPLKLKYIQPVQYKDGLQIINSWAFEIIK
ncbi:MAG TPA: outer membrane protein assembly factor BamE [Spirochaetota bacterium]|nr:outer membrane protein assembly factor BamE [Spirochaetota bacterium]